MKTKLLSSLALAFTMCVNIFAQTDANGYTTVQLTTGPSYQNRVFFDFSENNIVSQPADSWDIAFYRNSVMDYGIKVNDGKPITVYQVSANPSAFDSVDLSQKSTWGDPLYNPDQTERIQEGAFDKATLLPPGGFNFGWGSYDIVTHKLIGKVVFVLEYSDGTHYKFFINEYAAGYTFKYAKWNGTSWDATVTKTIANGTDDAFFNYFSFATGEKVPNLEPAKANWDLMFTRYYTFYANTAMYRLSGAIQSPNLTVAKVQPETQDTSTFTPPVSTSYSKNITTIGHSWKPTSGVYSDVVYYVKNGSTYYRMYFISNGGATTGNMYFKYKDITAQMAVQNVGTKASFGMYPNPTTADKKVTLLFDVKEKSNTKGSAEIYDMSGKKVYEVALANQNGLYQQDLNLQKLSAGVYMVKVNYGGVSETKKLIVK